MSNNYFVELNSINVNDKVEKKNGLSYLSWAWAWGELKKLHPDAIYTIYENAQGWNYHTDGRTAWVKVGVTVNQVEHIEELPIMDYKNKSIPIDNITSFEVNKSIQRALTKAVARHGLGLYIYAGEDLPEESDGKINATTKTASKATSTSKTATTATSKPTSTARAATATATTKKAGADEEMFEVKDSRTLLREFCKTNNVNQGMIIQVCNLRDDSTEQEWSDAFEYAKKTFGT